MSLRQLFHGRSVRIDAVHSSVEFRCKHPTIPATTLHGEREPDEFEPSWNRALDTDGLLVVETIWREIDVSAVTVA